MPSRHSLNTWYFLCLVGYRAVYDRLFSPFLSIHNVLMSVKRNLVLIAFGILIQESFYSRMNVK